MAVQKPSAQIYELKHAAKPADLPPAGVTRWVPSRKAQVVSAVRNGTLSLDEACARYALTVEEFLSWQRAVERFGISGLRATRAQQYRQTRH
jgi:hypothetical protein